MPENLNRRGFLKIAAGTGVATGLGSAIRSVGIEPYVRAPEEELPGGASWYASTCRQCPSACGILVRVINGRPRKIEGNPSHPLNRGKLCARGQSGLQVLYNPDRLQNAVRQTGGRGSRQYAPLHWAQALETISEAITSLEDRARVAFLGGILPDHLFHLVSRFQEALGAPAPVLFDLHSAMEGRAEAAAMSKRWFGSIRLPLYDIAHAEVIFSFGANFLETWMSPVSYSYDYGTMRQGRVGGRGFLVQFEPRLSATGACADEWIPIKPGFEGLIALGIGRIIVEGNLGRVGSHRDHAHLYRNVNPADIAEASGIPVQELQRLAHVFADADRSMAIPGGMLAGLSNTPDAMDAVMALNVILRRLGREGGVFLPQDVPSESFAAPIQPTPFADFENLVARMQAGEVEVLFVHSCNPVYELPAWTGFQEALKKVKLVVSFSSFVDETASWADLVLPDHTYLEGWGFQVASPGADRPVVSGQQPVVQPLYDTRSTADVFLALSAQIGGELAETLPWKDEVAFIEESSAELIGSSIGVYDAITPSGFWSRWRQYGGWWSDKPIRQEPEATGLPQEPLQVPFPIFNGEADQFPFHLLPYETITLSDGRGANQPWLQETPEPMTTARWNTWVELNPATASQLGLHDNDVVRVISAYGQLEAPVVLYPALRPDVVAIPIGQGHHDYGRFAAQRGVNVIELLAPSQATTAGNLAWGSTRVRLEAVNRSENLARLENLDGKGRETIR